MSSRENNVRVHTIQGYDLRTFNGPIELDRGTYKDNPVIYGAQRKLYDILKEDQVLWCSQDEPLLCGQINRYLYEIDLDSRDIITVIDSLVWCHIIKYNHRYIPPEEHQNLRFQASSNGGDNYEAALRKEEDEYLSANLPADLWSAVIKKAITKKSDQLLAKFPFTFSTIANVKIVSTQMAKR